jgi:hypothetical protein
VVNRRRPASTVPDVLIAFAAVGWTMALFFLLASFLDPGLKDQDAGPVLAQTFAAALAACGTFIFVIGLALLREDRGDPSHYLTPMILGFLVGLAVTTLFLRGAGFWIFAPFPLLAFSARPLRRMVARSLGRAVNVAVLV